MGESGEEEQLLSVVSQHPESLRYYQMREMGLSDMTSRINYAKNEGKIEGKIEGEKEGQLKIVKNMLREGMEIPLVSKMTGVDIHTITALQQQENN